MEDLLNDIRKSNKELNDSFLTFVLELVDYFRIYKYSITPSCVIDFFNMTSEFDILNIEDFYGISKTLFCKNQMEYNNYESLFNDFLKAYVKKGLEGLMEFEKQKHAEQYQELREKCKKEQLELEEKAINEKCQIIFEILTGKIQSIKKQQKIVSNLNKSNLERLEEITKQINKEYLKDFLKLNVDDFLEYVKKCREFPLENLKKDLNDFMLTNIEYNVPDDALNELVLTSANSISKINETYNKQKQPVEKKLQKMIKDNNKQLLEIQEIFKQEREGTIIKFGSKSHREGDFVGKNAIQDLLNINDKKINKLNEKEYESLLNYIKLNASKFRTIISRSMKQSKNKVFDYKKTMEKSIQYFGEPMKLYYKKPIIKKYKLICIMDISGSVSKYINLLSSFLYEVNTVFNGGISIYGFVSDLMDFSEMFKTNTLEDAVHSMKGHRGYSNYYKALTDFNEEYFKNVDKNTIIIFFGDARNNKNDTGIEYIQALKEKCKSIVWLNPEEKSKWNAADSIIGRYEPYIDNLYEVLDVKDLIDFMENFSLKRKLI